MSKWIYNRNRVLMVRDARDLEVSSVEWVKTIMDRQFRTEGTVIEGVSTRTCTAS